MADPQPWSHLLLSSEAPRDSLVSYLTDVRPVLRDNEAWLAARHRDGSAFATEVIQSCDAALEGAARSAKEYAEAIQATAAQTDAFANGQNLARRIRNRGSYIADELARSQDAKDRENARRVRVACGVGSRSGDPAPAKKPTPEQRDTVCHRAAVAPKTVRDRVLAAAPSFARLVRQVGVVLDAGVGDA